MSGYIYFITSEPDRYVKIGWAKHSPVQRLSTLQTGCPEFLRLMAYTPGSRDEERRLHETFAELHYRGEWFCLEHKLLDLVEYLSDNFPRETNTMASRETFEGAIWDVVITGFTHPDWSPQKLSDYETSGLGYLWKFMHPEMAE